MKQSTALLLILIAMLLFVMSLGSCSTSKNGLSNPVSIQVKIIKVEMVGKGKANITGIKMGSNDTCYLRYGWSAGSRNHNVKVGNWITVRYDGDKCVKGEWTLAAIKTNK